MYSINVVLLVTAGNLPSNGYSTAGGVLKQMLVHIDHIFAYLSPVSHHSPTPLSTQHLTRLVLSTRNHYVYLLVSLAPIAS